MHSGVIKLYDPKNYTAGPFNTFSVSIPALRATCQAPSHGHWHVEVGLLNHRHHIV